MPVSIDLSTILAAVLGVVTFIASRMVRSARYERDEANGKAENAQHAVKSLKNIEEIKRERQEKDNTIAVDRERPLGMWHNDGND